MSQRYSTESAEEDMKRKTTATTSRHAAELDAMQADHETNVAALQEEFESSRESWTQSHTDAIAQLRAANERAERMEASDHEESMARLKSQRHVVEEREQAAKATAEEAAQQAELATAKAQEQYVTLAINRLEQSVRRCVHDSESAWMFLANGAVGTRKKWTGGPGSSPSLRQSAMRNGRHSHNAWKR
jgi:hypothetical protein